MTATNGNFSVCCGQDVNVNAAITTTNGSVLLSAGRDINQFGAITVTDGNLMMCAAEDVDIHGAITLTRGTNDPTRSLGLTNGLVISADTDGTGPGIAGGTVIFARAGAAGNRHRRAGRHLLQPGVVHARRPITPPSSP